MHISHMVCEIVYKFKGNYHPKIKLLEVRTFPTQEEALNFIRQEVVHDRVLTIIPKFSK